MTTQPLFWPGDVPEPIPGYPRDLAPDLERRAVRVVLLDPLDRVLLFRVRVPDEDPANWWDLPGGGIDPGETYVQAAVREVFEETGLRIGEPDVGAPTWRRSATWVRYGRRRVQHEFVVLARISGAPEEIADRSGWTPEEVAEYTGARWWPRAEIEAGGARFYPGRLPELLPRFLAGELIDEPFEEWNH